MLPLYDTIPSRRWPLVNWMLILANVIVFFFEIGLGETLLQRFIFTWGLVPVRLFRDPIHSWHTIFSSMFLHGGWFHLLSNMWILFIFGDNVEDRLGHARYLLFYLLSGVAAALLQAFLMPLSRVPMVGASGAIAGILGAYMILFPYSRIVSLIPFFFFLTTAEIPAVIYLGFWFLSQLYSGLFSLAGAPASGIAWWAHIGGFLFGLLMIGFFAPRPRRVVYYSQDGW
uniref:Rhomboid family protein n=1 Tax=uncultured Chloroflexota bacterium TaxID=166587 RepID=H5SMW0_9CHLR|nr:rhomboid family protein [uncultured Chloroflexota bacterium]